MTTPPDFSFEVNGYDDLVEAFRARKAALGMSDAQVDERGGLQAGYVAKLLSDTRVKIFGPMSFDTIIQTLGLKLVAVADPDKLRQIERRLGPHEPRDERRVFEGISHMGPKLKRRLMSDLGKVGVSVHTAAGMHQEVSAKGGAKRWSKLSARERRQLAKRLAQLRWSKRQAAAVPALDPKPRPKQP